jgi:cobalt-zinc-cadmium efflux system outer membrane protein
VLGRPDIERAPLAGDVEGDLPTFDWEDTLERLLAESPELAQAHAGVERARCEWARQCAMRVPNLGLRAAVKYDTVSRYTVADLEFSLPLPLIDRNQGRILRAQADLTAAQNEVRRVELSLYDRLAAAFEQYATARRRVESYSRTILPHAKESLDLVSTGYREGEFGYLNLLTAQRTYFQASLDYLRYLRDFRLRCVDLEGMLLRGGLEQVQRPEPTVD